jgi:hypothetical protein
MFAGLNVLPKTAWFSSYSSGVTRDMNISFLRKLNGAWDAAGLLSDTVNLDFTAIPYWGDDDPFENNWSGKRNRAIASLQALLAQDPENGILCYGDTTVRHENEKDAALEFLDFRRDSGKGKDLKYLVFDSGFTAYEILGKLNARGIKFVTVQRRGKKLIEKTESLPAERWKDVRIEKANNKGRTVTVSEDETELQGYGGRARQIFIRSDGRAKPAIIITNDFSASAGDIIRKYARRWLVEKEISEQIEFFHLNRNSSGIVIKADFDLTMTILAHNLYRLLAAKFDGYAHCGAKTVFDKFVRNAGEVAVDNNTVTVALKKKRTLPLVLESFPDSGEVYPQLGFRKLSFKAANFT